MFKKIYIEITNICNLKCKFCPETSREKKYMTVDEFEYIIKQIRKYTDLVCLHVKGEPLMHPELKNILKVLEKYNLKANITTNGTLIKKTFNVLKESKAVRQINFSIHSLTQNDNIKAEYLEDIFNSAEILSKVKIISYRLWNDETNTDILKKIEEFYNISNLKERLKEKDFYKIKNNVFINKDLEFTWPNNSGSVINKEGRCLALKEQIAILVDGTVVPCCLDNNGDIPLGNIFKEEFDKILEKDLTKKIKENFKNKVITCDICKTCGFLKRLENKRKQLEKLT